MGRAAPIAAFAGVLAVMARCATADHLDAASRADSRRLLRDLRDAYNACRHCGGPVLPPNTTHGACAPERTDR